MLVEVDLLESVRGRSGASWSVEVPSGAPLRIPLPDNDGDPYGINVRGVRAPSQRWSSPSPIPRELRPIRRYRIPTATPLGVPVVRIAGTVGVETPSARWLLPGAGAVKGASTTIWLMNTGEDPATVTLKPLGVREMPADKTVVQPGRIVAFEVPDEEAIASYFVESTSPVSAAWTASHDGGTAFVIGVGIDA